MTVPKPARDARRLTRAPLLICSLAVALCAGAGAAAAQEPAPPTDDGSTTAVEDDPTSPTEGSETPAPEEEGGTDDQGRGSGTRLVLENVSPRTIFSGANRKAEFRYETAGARADLKIEAVKSGSGKVLKTWTHNNAQPGEKHRLDWNGAPAGGGKTKGRHFFRVKIAGGEALSRKRADGKRNVKVYPAKFPVRGKHQYWDGWGAGRGHQGQDVGASCGTPMVAAKAGKVAYRGNDANGWGHYVVINVAKRAHLYSHLKRKARVGQGKEVKTGQRIGSVGASGNASGCHLHFELWNSRWPGGNATKGATKALKKWDKWS